jgi:protease-4
MLDPTRPFTVEERTALERELEGMYRAFVSIVAAGRKLSVEEVEKVAEGRVWTGSAAATRHLVDLLGGFDVALERAKHLIGGPEAKDLEPGFVRAPLRSIGPLAPPAKVTQLLARVVGVEGLSLLGSKERVLAWSALASAVRD